MKPAWSAAAVAAGLAAAALVYPASAASVKIQAFGDPGTFHWHPDVRRIEPGDKVVWSNATGTLHTVTAYKGPWSKNSKLAAGASTSFTFNKTGTFKFRCTKHSTVEDGVCTGMCGKVRVPAPS